MIAGLLALIPGLIGPVMSYLAAAKNAQVAMYQTRFGADEAVAVAAIQAQANQNINSKWWQPQTLIGWIIVTYLGAAIVWDKVVAKFVGCSGHQPPGECTSFATDPLTGDLHYIMMMVIGGYFSVVALNSFLKLK